MIDFEKDLQKLAAKMQDDKYAQKVYAALCNVVWVHKSRPENYKQVQEDIWIKSEWNRAEWEYSCSWRSAGALVADIRDKGENYLDFYCNGNEGNVDEEVAEDLKVLDWEVDQDNHERWKKIQENQKGVNELEY
jgi:hypothetical protein